MEDKRIELNQLKNDIVRCVIPYRDLNGEDKQIEVYNITGDRRKQVVEKMQSVLDVKEDEIEYAVHEYYAELISEFTDIKLDITDINEILINPTLEFQILRKELDDMIYEIQYEVVCDQLRMNRSLMLNEMNQQSLKELKVYENFIESSDKMIESFNKGDKNGVQ